MICAQSTELFKYIPYLTQKEAGMKNSACETAESLGIRAGLNPQIKEEYSLK